MRFAPTWGSYSQAVELCNSTRKSIFEDSLSASCCRLLLPSSRHECSSQTAALWSALAGHGAYHQRALMCPVRKRDL
jgi:hypothetical protein